MKKFCLSLLSILLASTLFFVPLSVKEKIGTIGKFFIALSVGQIIFLEDKYTKFKDNKVLLLTVILGIIFSLINVFMTN